MERVVDDIKNYFEIFDLEPNFDIDKKALDSMYFDISKKGYIDNSLLNRAYSVLKCNVSRAEYILNNLLNIRYISNHQNILNLFETNEKIELLKFKKDYDALDAVKRSLKSKFRSLSTELTTYDIANIDHEKSCEIFDKIAKCKFIEKMISRINL